MSETNKNDLEVWLRGETVPGVSPYLQSAAHALLQAGEEIEKACANLDENLLWENPGGVAAVGFHLKHIVGFLDRLLSYAENKTLTAEQMQYLSNEGKDENETVQELLAAVKKAIENTIDRYKAFSDEELKEARTVGRKQLPSTVIGLCFHAAEHTMRHTGQLIATVKMMGV